LTSGSENLWVVPEPKQRIRGMRSVRDAGIASVEQKGSGIVRKIVFWSMLVVLTAGGEAGAQTDVGAVAEDAASEPPTVIEVVLDVSPRGLPTPLFRYRLLPTTTELNPGDAAPVYLRLNQQISPETVRDQDVKAEALLAQPFVSFAVAEGHQLIDPWSGRLRQVEFGTRRQGCHWDYTVLEEKDNPWSILLPDAQAMRTWGRLLAVKARVEIALGRFEDAIRTLETGIAFGRHVAEGPFYINKLIGASIVGLMLNRADELISQPGAPNLYWAWTALPQPLVSIREATEVERAAMGRAMTGQLLGEIDLDRPRSEVDWTTLLADLHARMIRMGALSGADPAPVATPDLASFRAAMLPKAREYLKAHQMTATSDDQALVLAIIGLYRELADDHFKLAYVNYPDFEIQEAEVKKLQEAAKLGPASDFARMLPNVRSAHLAEVRPGQKIAALRVVEAIRLHAIRHGGELPGSLDQIKGVPIPLDPASGRPFEYRREGATAILNASPIAGSRLVYRVKIRG